MAGVGDRDPEPGDQGGQGDGDDEGEGGPVHARQLGEVVLDQLHQPLPQQRRVGQLLPGDRVDPALPDPPRRRQRLEGLLEQVGVQGGELEPALAGPVPVVPGRVVGQPAGLGLFFLKLLALFGIGGLRAHDLEQPLAAGAELGGVELLGQVHHVRLGPLVGAGRQVVVLGREGLDRGDDDPGLLRIDPTGRQRLPGGLEPVGEVLGQVQVGEPGRPAGLRLMGQPRRGRGRTGLGADLVTVGLGQQPQLQLLQARPLTAHRDECAALFVGGHRPQRRIAEPVQGTGERVEEPHHLVRRRRCPGRRWRRCDRQAHDPTLEAGTDLLDHQFANRGQLPHPCTC